MSGPLRLLLIAVALGGSAVHAFSGPVRGSCARLATHKLQLHAASRRAAAEGLVKSVLAGAIVAPVTAQADEEEKKEASNPFLSSPFIGSYADPNHPKGYRIISVNGDNASIKGRDEPDGEEWSLTGKIKGQDILVDFRPKGGPANLKGTYKVVPPSGIVWPDGNKWTKTT